MLVRTRASCARCSGSIPFSLLRKKNYGSSLFFFEKVARVRLPACVSPRRKASGVEPELLFLKKSSLAPSLRSGSIALIAFAYHPSGDGETIGRRPGSPCREFYTSPIRGTCKIPWLATQSDSPYPFATIPLKWDRGKGIGSSGAFPIAGDH